MVVILGSLTGLAFGVFALASGLMMLVRITEISLFGASVVIYGLLLICNVASNVASFGDFSDGNVYEYIRSNTGVYIL